jgi:hypothetical protein
MDIEQLKLVLQSVDGVTEGAKQIGIGWLALDFLKDLGSGLLALYVFSRVYKAVLAIIESTRASGVTETRLREIRDTLVPAYAGTGNVTAGEFKVIQSRIEAKKP